MKTTEEVIQRFRQAGFKITPQRRAIFEVLAGNENHPSVEAMYQEIKIKMPDISLATLYNTLNELNALGLIDIVRDTSQKAVRYDPNTEPHDHLYCLQCNRMIDIENMDKDLELPEERSQGFHILRQQVTYYGYCPDCQKILEE
ncbi:MAG: transcriptional repressor [Anaerolineales bacterium]|nr:transcriptional repressor [Anaerolineales bacterium]